METEVLWKGRWGDLKLGQRLKRQTQFDLSSVFNRVINNWRHQDAGSLFCPQISKEVSDHLHENGAAAGENNLAVSASGTLCILLGRRDPAHGVTVYHSGRTLQGRLQNKPASLYISRMHIHVYSSDAQKLFLKVWPLDSFPRI